jgi:Putative MetA-pathway of phenol degradation
MKPWKLTLFCIYTLAVGCVPSSAQEGPAEPSNCLRSVVASVLSRPTVSNGAETTPCGVVEVEYGFDHQWKNSDSHVNDVVGGLRLGVLPNLDFHWASTSFLNLAGPSDSHSGFGDTWLGMKYHFASQRKYRPSMGVFYTAKVPSAMADGGTGEVDHILSFLFSKDVRHLHFDFNVTPYFAGRQRSSGYDQNVGFALSGAYPLSKKLSLVGEGYGYTSQNSANPAFASTMVGTTYQISPRLVLDGGVDLGVSSAAPHARVFFGVTYAIANVYRWVARPE